VQEKSTNERDESVDLAACVMRLGAGDDGGPVRLCGGLREGVNRRSSMIVVTAIVVLFLFGYLLAALIRPEWF
jgi:K+-transporting ATPase KdpF subunit